MASELNGGKTPPRLLQDLALYNPQRLPTSGFNVFVQSAVQFLEAGPAPKLTARNACRHIWILKPNQSVLPTIDEKPTTSSVYTVSACCSDCRSHINITIDFRGESSITFPCPKEGTPLHHFLYRNTPESGLYQRKDDIGLDIWLDERHFECSNPSCSARLTTRIRSPRLVLEWIDLLTNPALVRARAQDVMAKDPERFEGHAVPPIVQVLANLRAYLANALTSPEPRRILGNNKKFLLCLGEPCADLLQYLGFTRTGDDWMPPRPGVSGKVPYENPLNIKLDDTTVELLSLLQKQPEEDLRMAKMHMDSIPALPEFHKILGSTKYRTSLASSTIDLTQDAEDEHPFYAGLGTVLDYHDELLSFAYDRQVECDPVHAPYYLECLRGIATGRNSEDLQTKAAIEASSGRVSVKEIREAYQSFGLEYDGPFLDDDTIIGTFQSRAVDAPRQDAELRRALTIIGQERGSTKIQHVASNTVTTYEQALSWLGAQEDMDEEFLVSMYGIKVGENSTSTELARNCIALIAEKRSSAALRQWLDTGILGEVEMDFGQAYVRLNIDDRTIDDELILTTYNLFVQDTPSQIGELQKALAAIAKSRKSKYLLSFLDNGMTSSEHPLSDWPIGLENIGNTCYLNSLLQFYFTVKPLRDLVLNFDQYKTQVDDEILKEKQVGSRKVSRKEVLRAQRFVYELQKLFQSMIYATTAQVTPETELARLTLISSSTEETIRRQSLLGGQRPALGDINGQPLHGPLPKPIPEVSASDSLPFGNDAQQKMVGTSHNGTGDDASSDGTLVEAPAAGTPGDNDFTMVDSIDKQQQDQIIENKENLAPTKEDIDRAITLESTLMPLAESPSSLTNEQRPRSPVKTMADSQGDSKLINGELKVAPPPNRAPPVPPRQKLEDEKKAMQEEVEIGAQQDVTEVIANVLFQLQCAIKAESVDDSGEQIDQIKKLFFGKQKSYTTNEQGVIRSKEEFISDIKIDVASGPRDIYAALDGAFDVQEVEVGGRLEPQYATVSHMPPVMQILVQRAQFDQEKKTSFKSNHHLELKETIYMDRYLDSPDPDLAQRRQDSWHWKKELSRLEKRRLQLRKTEMGIDMSELLKATAGYLQQASNTDDVDGFINVKPELISQLEEESRKVKEELAELEETIKTLTENVHSQFADLRNFPYRLHSVFIHRGMVSSGHYWIYIYDFSKEIWRKYNDGYVTEVKDDKEIYDAEESARPATPYFLVYVKDNLKSDLVDAVCREIIEPQQESIEDTVMADDDAVPQEMEIWAAQDPEQRVDHDNIIW